MVFGEGALALQTRRDGCFEEFSQFFERRPRFGVVHALTGVDDWPLGTREDRGYSGDVLGVWSTLELGCTGIAQRFGDVLGHDIAWEFDQDRPRSAVADLH